MARLITEIMYSCLINSLTKKKVKGSNEDLAGEVGSGYSAENVKGK